MPIKVYWARRNAWDLGKPIWEVWSDKDPGIERRMGGFTGEPRFEADTCFCVQHNQFEEEVWASWAITPVPGPSGNLCYYNPLTEQTQQVLYDRRMGALMALEHNTLQLDDITMLWARIMKSLELNRADVPFAAVYSHKSSSHRFAKPEPVDWHPDAGDVMSRNSSNTGASIK
ncbi:hypothetical protein DOTSEDRAFT_23406 [Dothistroma septosporum NZE10]|uniref:Uncharacterized protein n=1 Tax=Dothistroma septosporum (strain NZE10 / CBS 128990) TaxID=675120 RepID=N1PSM9_DOTSN|nr:hypothetical protein DOTSEDRAFT_23406 [Dothistroma septosporum NZE10]